MCLKIREGASNVIKCSDLELPKEAVNLGVIKTSLALMWIDGFPVPRREIYNNNMG